MNFVQGDARISVFFRDSKGLMHASFVRDLSGALVYRDETGDPSSLVPYGIARVSCVFGEAHPLPYEVHSGSITQQLSSMAEAIPEMAPTIHQLYPGLVPAAIDALFVPASAAELDLQQLEEAVGTLRQLDPADDDDSVIIDDLYNALSGIGVYQIASLYQFNPDYHSPVEGAILRPGDPIAIVDHGWMQASSVIQKTTVKKTPNAG